MQTVLVTTNVSSNPTPGKVYSIQNYVIKFVSDLRQVGGFIRVRQYTNKTDCHDITEILLKVTLNTITPNPNPYINFSKLSPLILYFLSAINIMKKTKTHFIVLLAIKNIHHILWKVLVVVFSLTHFWVLISMLNFLCWTKPMWECAWYDELSHIII